MPLAFALLSDAFQYEEFRGWMIFVLGLAVYMFLFAWMRHVSIAAYLGLSVISAGLWTLNFVLWRHWKSPLGVAGVWVLLEQLRQVLGWGWLPLASAATTAAHPRMLAAIGGEPLLSFLIIWLGLSIARVSQSNCPPQCQWVRQTLSVVILWWLVGTGSYQQPMPVTANLNLAFVQPDIPMALEKSDEDIAREMQQLQRLTMAIKDPAVYDAILWPEQITPWPVNTDRGMTRWVESAARTSGSPIIMGALWRQDERFYNAVSMVTPKEGLSPHYYAKRRLVPFGEFVPLSHLGWSRSLTPIVASFDAGTDPEILELKGVKLFPLVCYEDTFSALTDGAGRSADAMIVVTNDAWFGKEGAQAQHVTHAILRAIEQGIPVVRVANDGLSGIVSPKGEFVPVATGALERSTQGMRLVLRKSHTVYSLWPDFWRWIFPSFAVVLGFVMIKHTPEEDEGVGE